ncbi:hypothetical protein K440DRAFT_625186 [Wilcoxina mikolae CBS 423.85]|nr:hypothetical protein K440DRAFT_625186 [Wilcoxina mikolae CBS 423.85]
MFTPPLITLAPEGDIILDICDSFSSDDTSPARIRFLVASQILCTSSPVFLTMLSKTSPFSEAAKLHDLTRKIPITISLSDDDPTAFSVVLNILHLRNRAVQKHPPRLRTLLAIMDISDKYQLYEALMFVTDLWCAGISRMDLPLLEKIMLAWAFRYEAMFREATRDVLLQSHCVTDGSLVLLEDFRMAVLKECLPECLNKALIEKRNMVIEHFKTELQYFRTEKCARPQPPVCTAKCDSRQRGHFWRIYWLYQLEVPSTWLRSIGYLSSMLRHMPRVDCTEDVMVRDHSWNIDLQDIVDEALMMLKDGLSLSDFPSREVVEGD